MVKTETVQVCVLGQFSIRYGEKVISDQFNRSNKLWLLLAYLLFNRSRVVTQQEIIDLMWGDSDSSGNPENALKTILHRTRTLLDELGEGLGKRLIQRRRGSYRISDAFRIVIDCEQFEQRSHKALAAEDKQLQQLLQAVALYRGDLLPRLSGESWVIPKSAALHEIYLETAGRALQLLLEEGRVAEAEELAHAATHIDEGNESFFYALMQAQTAQGKLDEVVSTYNELGELLYRHCGMLPSDQTRALYRAALRTVNHSALDLVQLQEQLAEPDNREGAYMCDYDFFKTLYQAMSRSLLRTGAVMHLALLSITNGHGGVLPKRSMDTCVDNLDGLLRHSLRRGDMATRCSISQFALLLPQADYEDSCKVMERVVKAFQRQYPHSPATLQVEVLPVQ